VYCSKCGSQISPDAVTCPACGQPVGGGAPVRPSAPAAALPVMSPPPAYDAAVYASPATVANSSGVLYAGFWLRFVAFLIDGFLRGLAFFILLVTLLVLSGAGSTLSRLDSGEDLPDQVMAALGITFLLGSVGIVLLVSWLYFAFFESSSWQATPGKKLLNLYVTDTAGQPVSFVRASGRYFAKIISSLIPFGIGYVLAGLTEKKQAIHDMLAGCLVLRRS
jgi:uncharacterized RDD family membrane protein YckC